MFLDKDFLLNTETAKRLYHEAAEQCPIIDYHCHINPREIWEDRKYDSITQVWLGGDHYKWRLMRSAGVPEKYITGTETTDREKFMKWAEVLGKAIGNPLYHWSHLELRRFFGYEGVLNRDTAEAVYDMANAKLHEAGYSVRGLINMSNVETICTTDDPVDSLEWHEKLAADKSFKTAVLPAWRPDKAMNLEKETYPDYLKQLADVSGVKIDSFEALKKALALRMDFFHDHNCRLSDHALNYVMYAPADAERVEAVFKARLNGTLPTPEEENSHAAALRLPPGQQPHHVRQNGPRHRLRLRGQLRALGADRRVPGSPGSPGLPAQDHTVLPQHQRQCRHRQHPGLLPE